MVNSKQRRFTYISPKEWYIFFSSFFWGGAEKTACGEVNLCVVEQVTE